MRQKGGSIAWMGLAATLALAGCATAPEKGPDEQAAAEDEQTGTQSADSQGQQAQAEGAKSGTEAESQGLGEGAEAESAGLEGQQAKAEPAVTEPDSHLVHFAFDSSNLSDEARERLRAHADYLKANQGIDVVLEGHADERGSREYNLALGERRAKSVRRILLVHGVNSERLEIVSYGEERPLVEASSEEAYRKNRRVKLAYEE